MLLTSILRTVLPATWALFITWLLTQVPMLEPLRELLLEQADVLVVVAQGVIIGAWYAFSRWLEPRVPGWLRTILMGSSKTPVYPEGKHVQDH